MQPRLSTSRKWTPLPKELMQQVKSVYKETFAQHIGLGILETEGRIYPEEILIRVGYRAKDALKQSNFEVSIAYKKDKDNVLKLLHIGIDAAASLLDQLFTTDTDEEFPRKWAEVDFEGRTIYVQYNTVNSELEAEADRLLGARPTDDATLVQGDWDEDISLDQVKASLGIDPEELEDETEEPVAKPKTTTRKRTDH